MERYLPCITGIIVSALPGNLSFLPPADIDSLVHLSRLTEVKNKLLNHQDCGYKGETQDEAACSKAQRE